MMQKITQKDPTATLLIAESLGEGPACKKGDQDIYGKGCLAAFRAKILGLEVVLVEFDSAENAKATARFLQQWSVKNWLLDEVTGERPLEIFFQESLEASFCCSK